VIDDTFWIVDAFNGPQLRPGCHAERHPRLVADGDLGSAAPPRRPLNHRGVGGAGPRRARPEPERDPHDRALLVLAALGAGSSLSYCAGLAWAWLGWEPFSGFVLIAAAFWLPFLVAIGKR
jgi:hypothetical protein